MKKIIKLLEKLNIKTNNLKIYENALTHSSYANENKTKSNERLEFLGDAVLELLSSDYLYKNHPNEDEGFLTKTRAQRVCEEALAQYAEHISLESFLFLGKGEAKGTISSAIIADAFEAFLGAIYLDQGIEKAREVFNNLVVKNINDTIDIIDYKTKLQEIYAPQKITITYKVVKQTGPAHRKRFTSACIINRPDEAISFSGEGATKKESQQNAAKAALKKENISVT